MGQSICVDKEDTMPEFYRIVIQWRSSPNVYWDVLFTDVVYGKNVYDVYNRVGFPIVQSDYFDMDLDNPDIWTCINQKLDFHTHNRGTQMFYTVEVYPNDWRRLGRLENNVGVWYKYTSDNTLVRISE